MANVFIPGCLVVSGEAPLALVLAEGPAIPSAVQPTTVIPPNRLSVSAELLLFILLHKDDLSTRPESVSCDPSSPVG